MNHARIAFIMSILILSSVGATAEADTTEFDGSWVLISARAPETIKHGTLTINGMSFAGTTACNRYGGTFTFTDDGYASIENVVKTSAACIDPNLNEDEDRYIEAFSKTRIMRITPSGILTLQGFADDGSVVILTYERANEPTEHLIGVIGISVSATVEPGEEATLSFVVADRRSEGATVRYFLNYGGNEYVKMLANPMQFSLGPGERETITLTVSSASIGRYSFDVSVHEEALVGTQDERALATQTLSLEVHEGPPPSLEGQWILVGSRMPDGRAIERASLHITTEGFRAGTACNTVFGTLYYGVIPRQFVDMSVQGGTERYCDDLANTHEQRYIEALNAVSDYRMENANLILSGSLEGSRFELRYERSEPAPDPKVIEPPVIEPIPPAVPPGFSMRGYYVSEDRTRGGMLSIHQESDERVGVVIGNERHRGVITTDGDPGSSFEIEFMCAPGALCPRIRGTIHTYDTLVLYEGTLVMDGTFQVSLFEHRAVLTGPDTPAEPRYPQRTIDEYYQTDETAPGSAPEPILEPAPREVQITFHGVERPRIFRFIPNPFAQPLASFSVRTQSGPEQHKVIIGSTIEIEGERYRVYDDRVEPISER
jgi:heat shock protein HslJ